MKHRTLAIPIRCVDYSNTSQIVSMFSREEGLLEGIAKGAHRPKNSFQGPFDLAVTVFGQHAPVSHSDPSAGNITVANILVQHIILVMILELNINI